MLEFAVLFNVCSSPAMIYCFQPSSSPIQQLVHTTNPIRGPTNHPEPTNPQVAILRGLYITADYKHGYAVAGSQCIA